MIPVRLTLHNFLSYRDATLEFSGFDLAVLSGSNGVGKSSLLEAITWCVWEQARAASTDDLIHQGEQAMWVEYVFEHEGALYRIVRRRQKKTRGGETTLEFQIKDSSQEMWKSLTEGTIRITQDKIIKTLRLPYEIFVNSSYLRQGHADEFTVKTPAQRKAILAEILGLTLYDTLETRAREKGRQSENRAQLIKLQVEELTEQLSRSGVIETELTQITKEHGQAAAMLGIATKNLEKLNDERTQYEKINQQLELERKHFTTLQEELKRIMGVKDETTRAIKVLEATLENRTAIETHIKELALVKKELDDLTHTMMVSRELSEQLAVGESRKADLERTIERLTTLDTCPTCLRILTKAEAKKIIDQQTHAFAQLTGGNLTTLKQKIAKLGYSQEQFMALQQRGRALEPFQKQHEELKLAQAKIEEKQQVIKELERQVVAGTKQLASITESGRALKLELAHYSQAAEKYEQEKIRVEMFQIKVVESQRRLGGLQEQVKRIKEQQTRSNELEKELAKLQGEAQGWQTLALAFSKKGIQAMIIEQSLPAIEQEANVIAAKLSDGRLKIRFETQRSKKTSEDLIETLDIIVADELGERPYELYSGGEGFRINFAIRVAISKLLSMRAGAKLKFLVIDEGFGMLDQAGQQDIIAAINAIREDFAKVIVVSHLNEVKDAFQTRIEVTKNQNGSQITLLT